MPNLTSFIDSDHGFDVISIGLAPAGASTAFGTLANTYAEPVAIWLQLQTSAAVANRQLYIIVQQLAGIFLNYAYPDILAPSTLYDINLAIGFQYRFPAPPDRFIHIPMPEHLLISPGGSFQFNIINMDAADQWQPGNMTSKLWLKG